MHTPWFRNNVFPFKMSLSHSLSLIIVKRFVMIIADVVTRRINASNDVPFELHSAVSLYTLFTFSMHIQTERMSFSISHTPINAGFLAPFFVFAVVFSS